MAGSSGAEGAYEVMVLGGGVADAVRDEESYEASSICIVEGCDRL